MFNFEISGNDSNDKRLLKSELILVTLLISNFEISGTVFNFLQLYIFYFIYILF
jgi:hypothetical protein